MISFLITNASYILAGIFSLLGIFLGSWLASRRFSKEMKLLTEKEQHEEKEKRECKFHGKIMLWCLLGDSNVPKDLRGYENFWLHVANDRVKLFKWIKENELCDETHDFIVWLDSKLPGKQLLEYLNEEEG